MLSYLKKLPAAVLFFLAIEFSERASYYGYRVILKPYLLEKLKFSPERVDEIIRSNIALTYLAPVLGGLLADWFFGKYLSIVGFALICCLGHGLLAVSMDYGSFSFLHGMFANGFVVFQAGLFCIALGSGGLKPNNSGMFGDQFQGKYEGQLENAFRWFYASINVGSLLVNMVLPKLTEVYSYKLGFGIPGILMLISVFILISGRKTYFNVKPTGLPKTNFLFFNLQALWLRITGVKSVWNTMRIKHGTKRTEHLLSIWNVAAYFLFFAAIFALYDMNGAEWVGEARYLDRSLLGMTIPYASIQTVNPLFIIILVPILVWFFQRLKDKGIDFPMRRQVFWGMIFVLVASLLEGAIKTNVEFWLDANPMMRDADYATAHPEIVSGISMWWQVLAYLILTMGEVLFSIAGLTLGFRYAAPGMKSSVMSVWYLSTSMGNYVAAAVNSQMGEGEALSFLTKGGNYYWFFCGLLVVNAVLYLWITPYIPEKLYDNEGLE